MAVSVFARPTWRFVLRPVVILLVLGLATYVLLPEVDSLKHSVRSLGHAQWWMLPLAVLASVLSFVGSAMSIIGATALSLHFGRTILANLAATFAGRLAPANVGSLGALGSYLHKQGASVPEATAALGLDAVAGVVVHLGLLAIAAASVGQVPHRSVRLPDHWLAALLVVIALVGAGAATVYVLVRTNHHWGDRVRQALREGWDGLAAAVRDPRRAVLLLGGSAVITASQILTLYICLLAFRSNTALVTVSFVYLAGSAIAAAAPTPGGLGAFEAAMVSGLALFGTGGGPAIAGVLLYRLITFWLPILPGAAVFKIMRSRQDL